MQIYITLISSITDTTSQTLKLDGQLFEMSFKKNIDQSDRVAFKVTELP